MDEHIAVKGDWNTKDMPEKNTSFSLNRSFTLEQMKILYHGHIPVEMEDKWFWYVEENKLYAHRSWTGICIFTVEFRSDNNHIVTVNRDSKQYESESIVDDYDMVNCLLDQWAEPSYDYYREWISETVEAIKKNGL